MPKEDTQFKAGHSGNPAGRPKLTVEEKNFIKLTRPLVVRMLAEVSSMTHEELNICFHAESTPGVKKLFIKTILDGLSGDSVKACEFILNRTIGKPIDEVKLELPVPTYIKYLDGSVLELGARYENAVENEFE